MANRDDREALDRRAFLIASGAASLAAMPARAMGAVATPSPAHVWDRPLHVVYARSGGKAFGDQYSDDDFLRFFKQVPGGLTAAVPFLLNVPDASRYAGMLGRMKQNGIVIVPGVGQKPGDGPINVQKYKDMGRNYRPFTDYIRLENLQGYYDEHGPAPIQDMIDYLLSLGFRHIMMNPWPKMAGGSVVPFTAPQLDSSIYQVLLDFDHQSYRVVPDAENWSAGNQTKIDAVRRYRPSIDVLINYESAPQHEVLAQLEKDKPKSSIAAMGITVDRIRKSGKKLHWCPPFTTIYDPVRYGTWDWIAATLGSFR